MSIKRVLVAASVYRGDGQTDWEYTMIDGTRDEGEALVWDLLDSLHVTSMVLVEGEDEEFETILRDMEDET